MVSDLRQKFTTLPRRLTPKVPFMNIIMIGVTGSGKSSFLRTFTTALRHRDTLKDIYRTCPLKGREDSATKTVRYKKKPHYYKSQFLNKIKIKHFNLKAKTIHKIYLINTYISEKFVILNDF